MKQEIIISKIKCRIKKTKRPIGLIIFIPGILTPVSLSDFLSILKIKTGFDVLTYDVYIEANNFNIHKGINNLVADFEVILNSVRKIYKKIFLISYSSGSEVLLMAKFPSEVKAIALWSPSFFYPQNITETLKQYKENKKFLIYGKILIGKKLARDLDSLNTIKLLNSIRLPVYVYSSLDEQSDKSWANPEVFKLIPSINKKHSNVPYKHIYTKEQIISLYLRTCEWFVEINQQLILK